MECIHRKTIQNKLKLLFEKLMQPQYVVDNYYADALINKLSNCSDPEINFLATVPFISDLIIEVFDRVKNPHITVRVFGTRICAIASKKELHFAKIFAKHGKVIQDHFHEVCSPDSSPSLRVAYMEVAIAIATHTSGVLWILESGVWKYILLLYQQKTTVFVVRQIEKFVVDFIWTLNDMGDSDNIKLILAHLFAPLMSIDFINLGSLTCEEYEELCKTLEPIMQLLFHLINKENRIEQDTLVMNVIIKEQKIRNHLLMALDRLRNDDTSILLAKIIFRLTVAKTFLSKPYAPGVVYKDEDFLEVGAVSYNLIHIFIRRRNAVSVIEFASACTIFWNNLVKGKESMWGPQGDDRKHDIRDQMFIVCLVPVMTFVLKGKSILEVSDAKFDEFINKLLDTTCQYSLKSAYSLRDLTVELDTMTIILQSVKKLLHLKEHLNDTQANILFQALFHVLRDYAPGYQCESEENEIFEDSEEKNLALMYVMDCVLSLITYRDINWQESFEILCLYKIVCLILKRSNLSYKFVVKSLNVITVTVKKFLQPNLSLLMDSQPGSAILELGSLLYMKMQDRQWEIRDTALELLYVCTDISYIKFPPFQKQILEHSLINLAATIAFNDFEAYVQVSALRCIGAASRISAIWDQLLAEYPDMQERLLHMLLNNSEGNVRKEACNALCHIYQHHKIPPLYTSTIFQHMVSSALCDFHWEVQISALTFWRKVYQSLLMDHGMLDGAFPPVTFCKETRKIITLNDAKIQNILLKILDELAASGCLTVFVRLLQEDTEVEIMDAALGICQELYDILNKYKIPECVTPKPGDILTVEELMANISEDYSTEDSMDTSSVSKPEDEDHIIDDILNVDDANLLAGIYERHMTLQAVKKESPLIPKVKLNKYASPYLFVSCMKNTDFNQIIAEKRKWNVGIRSMSSLLDDMLGTYETGGEVNALDCY